MNMEYFDFERKCTFKPLLFHCSI